MEENREQIHKSGLVESVIFNNTENGYAVICMDLGEELMEARGILGNVRPGEQLEVFGEYVNDAKYGRQFNIESFEHVLPKGAAAIKKYLSSGIIRGVGSGTAEKIVKAFGDDSLEIIQNDPLRLASIKGIKPELAKHIGEEFNEITGFQQVMTFFSKYSVQQHIITAAWKEFGLNLIGAVQSNPYCLCSPEIGMRFDKADSIAKGLGFPQDSIERAYAAIIEALRISVDEGHCCTPESELCEVVTGRFVISDSLYYDALELAKDRGDIVSTDIYDGHYVYLERYYSAEKFIADKIAEMVSLDKSGEIDFSDEITTIEEERDIKYEGRQREAINGCMNNHIFILTGGPGTGKTTTLKAVIELCKRRRVRLKLAAPTGRAAKRMTDLTGAQAQTIHRLLEVDFTENTNNFKRNEDNPLECEVLIVDEMSMVDTLLFESLLRALRSSTRLIMVGDSNQLPPVGAGNVLHDLIDSEVVPSVQLEEIFRQAEESLIVTNAHSIVHGDMPDLDDKKKDFFFMPTETEEQSLRLALTLCQKRLPEAYHYDPFDDIQVLCLSRVGTVGVENVNKALQMTLNPSSGDRGELRLTKDMLLRQGDKIMQNKNDYDVEWRRGTEKSYGIYNGDIGRIIRTDRANQRCEIDFEGRRAVYDSEMLKRIEHAYAITVHKSQGSEYPAVILLLPNGMYKLSYRNLLYTAVTRARERIIVIGKREKVYQMVKNDQTTKRFTCLKLMLEDSLA